MQNWKKHLTIIEIFVPVIEFKKFELLRYELIVAKAVSPERVKTSPFAENIIALFRKAGYNVASSWTISGVSHVSTNNSTTGDKVVLFKSLSFPCKITLMLPAF